ncbi:hypothetical protein IKR20_08360 [bacterium]|nr:hypothetical protein [bacterium]
MSKNNYKLILKGLSSCGEVFYSACTARKEREILVIMPENKLKRIQVNIVTMDNRSINNSIVIKDKNDFFVIEVLETKDSEPAYLFLTKRDVERQLKAQKQTGYRKRKQSNNQYLYISKESRLRKEFEEYKHENFDEIKQLFN